MLQTILTFLLAVFEIVFQVATGGGNIADNGKIDVCFDALNGDPAYSYVAEENDLLEEPENPQRRGLIFEGWYVGDKKWDFENDTVKEDTTLTAKWKISNTFYDNDPNAGVRAEGSNLRIMSFNILASDWNNKPQVKDREDELRDVIYRYKPDVIGMQEVNKEWYDTLKNDFSSYKIINENNIEILGEVNYSTIAYNSDTVELIKYSQKHYAVRDSDNCRNITWALFEQKDSGKRFIVTSTHWDLKPELRENEAMELGGYVRILEEYYKVPVFSCGDYNARENTKEYQNFIKCSNFKSAKYSAEKRGLVSVTGHLGDGSGKAEDFNSGYWALGPVSYRKDKVNSILTIDHIFASSSANILFYDTVVDAAALRASDHCPIYIDAKI